MAIIRAMMGSLMAASQFAAEHGIAGHHGKASEAAADKEKIKHENLLSEDWKISRSASIFDVDLRGYA